MRTRLALLAALTFAALFALPAAASALANEGPGHQGGGASGSGERREPVDHGSSGSGPGDYADSSGSGSSGSTGSGSGHDHVTAPTPAAGPPVGRVADRQGKDPRLSTTPTPAAEVSDAAPAGRASAAVPAAESSALTPTSVAVAAAVFVLAGMVAAGFRARVRLGRLG